MPTLSTRTGSLTETQYQTFSGGSCEKAHDVYSKRREHELDSSLSALMGYIAPQIRQAEINGL